MKTNNTYKRKKYISVMHLQKLKHKEKINKKTVLGHVRVLSETCPAMSGIDADCNSRSDPDISRTI